jgi:terminal uridylyltransferase
VLPETKFHVKPLPHARIPIVKLSLDPSPGLPHGIACDIGFENRLALENTRLLMCYAMIDPTRVRTLVLFREFNRGLSTFFDDSTAL